MKSEPDVFSIDDLASRPDATEPWDGKLMCLEFELLSPSPSSIGGLIRNSLAIRIAVNYLMPYCCTGVRNHQAKKILQAMRLGDQAFFYASNCKEPGIVGIVEVSLLTATTKNILH